MEGDELCNGAAKSKVPLYPWGNMEETEFYEVMGVSNTKGFFRSPRGLSLFTQSWMSCFHAPKALIFMVHGYGNDTSWQFQKTAISLTEMGYAAFAMDLEGHGRSDGLKGFIPDADAVAKDCLSFFNSVKQREELQGLPCFLYGESLGGAICLLIHFMDPHGWDGAILVAAMCKISDSMKPPWPVPEILTCLANWVPTWAVVPSKDLVDRSIQDPIKREIGRNNPRRYAGKPRLGTVAELLRVTSSIEKKLEDVSLPFMVLHGDADVVTDPSVSKALHDRAKSVDKTLRIYKGMKHSLLQGEFDENVALVLADIKKWLEQRVVTKMDTCT